jgi:hypothetical protein
VIDLSERDDRAPAAKVIDHEASAVVDAKP